MASSPTTSGGIDGETVLTVRDFISWAPKSLQMVTAAMKLKDTCSLEENLTILDSILKSRNITLLTKVHIHSQSYGFSSSHVQLWEMDHKEGRAPKKWCFWTVVLEKTLDSPLDYQEIKPVNPKGNQCWIFIGRADAEALPFWSPDVKGRLTGKDPDAGKDWRQEVNGAIEGEMVGWHHRFDGHEFEQTQGDGEAQQRVGCHLWGRKESDTTERLDNKGCFTFLPKGHLNISQG